MCIKNFVLKISEFSCVAAVIIFKLLRACVIFLRSLLIFIFLFCFYVLKMAKLYDNDDIRVIDRAMAVAFRIARDEGADFIDRAWVAKKLKRSVPWVGKHWNKSPDEILIDRSNVRPPLKLSQESRDIVAAGRGLQRKSCRKLAGEIFFQRFDLKKMQNSS
jgi:hypothetical protein